MLTLATTTTVSLAAGYVLGRVRPWDRLDTFVWRRLTFGGAWTRSKPQTYLTFWLFVLVRPFEALHAWRHRNDPPPPRGPALTFDPNWRTNRPQEKP